MVIRFDNASPEKQPEHVFLKCNTCQKSVRAYGIQEGDTCSIPRDDTEALPCHGKMLKVNSAVADIAKRRSDGAAQT